MSETTDSKRGIARTDLIVALAAHRETGLAALASAILSGFGSQDPTRIAETVDVVLALGTDVHADTVREAGLGCADRNPAEIGAGIAGVVSALRARAKERASERSSARSSA